MRRAGAPPHRSVGRREPRGGRSRRIAPNDDDHHLDCSVELGPFADAAHGISTHHDAASDRRQRRRRRLATSPADKPIVSAYESYLTDLSGLDDNLSKGYIAPLASVTTTRLAQASVRQAAAILAAKEHGVGTLHDDQVTVVMTGPDSAALADCQDEYDFYLVSDDNATPDPFVQRGDFAGSAQMVLQNGHWLVDVFTTTHVACSY